MIVAWMLDWVEQSWTKSTRKNTYNYLFLAQSWLFRFTGPNGSVLKDSTSLKLKKQCHLRKMQQFFGNYKKHQNTEYHHNFKSGTQIIQWIMQPCFFFSVELWSRSLKIPGRSDRCWTQSVSRPGGQVGNRTSTHYGGRVWRMEKIMEMNLRQLSKLCTVWIWYYHDLFSICYMSIEFMKDSREWLRIVQAQRVADGSLDTWTA